MQSQEFIVLPGCDTIRIIKDRNVFPLQESTRETGGLEKNVRAHPPEPTPLRE